MDQKLLHTPEGVRDIYNEECERKLTLQNQLHEIMKGYGYRDIETPTFEFFEVFSKEVGTTPSRDLYKFFDKEGNTLVMRPDITPSIARAAAGYFSEETDPIRLCYVGNTFINNSSYQGRLKETTQLGAELIGDNSVDSDAEMIAMVADCLLKAGLKEFQVSIGQVDFFEALSEEAGIEGELEDELKRLISNKNNFGVEELLSEQNIRGDLKELFVKLPKLYGGVEVLHQAGEMTENKKALDALKRLEEMYEILSVYGIERYVSFDLGMLSKYMYYTGVIFRAYTFGTGDAVVKGGRYDRLLGHFGKEAPSIGFAVEVNQLLNALERQKISVPAEKIPVVLRYRPGERADVIRRAREMRQEGQYVALVPERE
ncbi:MAG: ATP phosphoribosyltransferase regulatory subunit [Blautia sp.]|nr:ATP phosphoribosyltransferase regulatory subunit [Blautia sp.]MDY4515429.1 ATP phosphoribosyltransferase regulatory subunit [Lachnospiraceae bacterium]